MAYAGQGPTKHTAIQKENGEITRSLEEVRAIYIGCGSTSTEILISKVDQDVVGQMSSWPTEWEFYSPPSDEKMLQALGKL